MTDEEIREIRAEAERLVGPQAMYELLGPVVLILEMRRAELNDLITRVAVAAEVARRQSERERAEGAWKGEGSGVLEPTSLEPFPRFVGIMLAVGVLILRQGKHAWPLAIVSVLFALCSSLVPLAAACRIVDALLVLDRHQHVVRRRVVAHLVVAIVRSNQRYSFVHRELLQVIIDDALLFDAGVLQLEEEVLFGEDRLVLAHRLPRLIEIRRCKTFEVSSGRGMVEVVEVTRSGRPVRMARFLSARVVAIVEHPAADSEETAAGSRSRGFSS